MKNHAEAIAIENTSKPAVSSEDLVEPDPSQSRNMNELSEEELLKQGIHLTHRLSAAEVHRDFNWDEDDDEEWTVNNLEEYASRIT